MRTRNALWNESQIELYAADIVYIFKRGNMLAAFPNNSINITYQVKNSAYAEGTKLCNVLQANDCVTVTNGNISINLIGEAKLYEVVKSS